MEKKSRKKRTVPEQFGQMAVGFAAIARQMNEDKRKSMKKKSDDTKLGKD